MILKGKGACFLYKWPPYNFMFIYILLRDSEAFYYLRSFLNLLYSSRDKYPLQINQFSLN